MGKVVILLSVFVLFLAGCSSQKQPAEAAFAQVQASVTPVSAELEKYAPEEFAQLSALIDDMKSKLNTKDYAGALAARTQVMTQLVSVSGVASKRKNELSKQMASEWKQLTVAVPVLLAQLNSRLNYLQGGKKLPAEISAATVQQATQSLAELNLEWTAALAAIKSRDTDTAVGKAQTIKKRGAEIAASLGMKPAS